MRKMRLNVKLTGSYLVIALIGALIGYIGIVNIRAIEKGSVEMHELGTKPIGDVGRLAVAFERVRNNLRDIVIDKFLLKKDINGYVETIQDISQKIETDLKLVETSLQTEEGRKEFASLKGAIAEFNPVKDKMIAYAESGKRDEAMGLMRGEALTLAKAIDASTDKILGHKIALAKASADENSASAKAAVTFVLAFAIAGVFIAACLGFFLTRSITVPINRVVTGMNDGVALVGSASSQVSQASQSLAEGSSEQVAGIEEISSSLEEMSSMTKQNADNAWQAKTLIAEAGQIVENVNQHMGLMSEAIAKITKSSKETGKIVKTIDEIAFQTNLLALNAAVEAARSGEAGAGFAVVADEVRNLAVRVSEAAKNTNNLIENTLKTIKNGHDLTLATQEAFERNVEVARKIGTLIEEIAAASQEQAQGISQVNKAVAEMDKVTHRNAAYAETWAVASGQMSAEVEHMKGVIGELVSVIGGSNNENGLQYAKDVPLNDGQPTISGHAFGNGGRKKEQKVLAATAPIRETNS